MNQNILERFRSELTQAQSNQETSLVIRPKSLARTSSRANKSVRLPSANLLMTEEITAPCLHGDTTTTAPTHYSSKIESTYADFGLPVKARFGVAGPRLYQYEIRPGYIKKTVKGEEIKRRVKVGSLTKLEEDLALVLACQLRLTKPNSKPYLALEIPRSDPQLVSLYQVLSSPEFSQIELDGGLGLALGLSATGQPIVADLTDCPHILIAGATYSGKSICIHALISSLLMNHGPDSLQLLLIDPKRVELTAYRSLPHLVRPVITEVEVATTALQWAVSQMEARFDLLEEAGQRDILRYNDWARKNGKEPLPYLVIIIDELADLMMQAKDEVEPLICRLAQMARAVGIHLVLATQRPSVDVVTGLIKANIPARIAFQTASGIDSKVILDTVGAEKLLGKGDCLVRLSGVNLVRAQGCFVADAELEAITGHWKGVNVNDDEVIIEGHFRTLAPNNDSLLQAAIKIVAQEKRASVSLLQRRLRVSYMKAAELVEALRKRGLIG